MKLFPGLEKAYTKEHKRAGEAQEMAYYIAFGPIIFQVGRLMIKFGILDMLRDSEEGMTQEEIVAKTGLSPYAVKVLMEGSLCIGLVLVDKDTDRFTMSKTGFFLLTDTAIRANIDFNHDVNYEGWFLLEEALKEGRPAGLKHFGDWPTIYEGLSQLPEQVQKSWFGFDHFYSDHSFSQALQIIFNGKTKTKTLLDVGGNTGRWALRCVDFDEDVNVTIMDLPQQLEMMRKFTKGKKGYERIDGYGINLLDDAQQFPTNKHYGLPKHRKRPASRCMNAMASCKARFTVPRERPFQFICDPHGLMKNRRCPLRTARRRWRNGNGRMAMHGC